MRQHAPSSSPPAAVARQLLRDPAAAVVLAVHTGDGGEEVAVVDAAGTVLLQEPLTADAAAGQDADRLAWPQIRRCLEWALRDRAVAVADLVAVRAALRRAAMADEPSMGPGDGPDPVVERWLASLRWVPVPDVPAGPGGGPGGGAVDDCRALLERLRALAG